jgi:hypothetical protein
VVHNLELHSPLDNPKGYLCWKHSKYKNLLKKEIDNGLHETMKPHQLHKTHPEYMDFLLPSFACTSIKRKGVAKIVATG